MKILQLIPSTKIVLELVRLHGLASWYVAERPGAIDVFPWSHNEVAWFQHDEHLAVHVPDTLFDGFPDTLLMEAEELWWERLNRDPVKWKFLHPKNPFNEIDDITTNIHTIRFLRWVDKTMIPDTPVEIYGSRHPVIGEIQVTPSMITVYDPRGSRSWEEFYGSMTRLHEQSLRLLPLLY